MTNVFPEREEIRRALRILFEEGQVTELRALEVPTGRGRPLTVSGYFDDYQSLAKSAEDCSRQGAKGVYVVLNPVNPALLARAQNKVIVPKSGGTTKDTDVDKLKWLMIDLDPLRPSGISATTTEQKQAYKVAGNIYRTLKEMEWPEPIISDSGNGVHLLYRIDLPVDKSPLVEECLSALAFRFDTKYVSVDRKVFNPSRIWKLYGTVSRKGDNTETRPHRIARMRKVPSTLEVVPRKLLTQLSKMVPSPPRGRPDGRLKSQKDKIVTWIHKHSLDVSDPQPWSNKGKKWVFRQCPWDEDHRDGSAYIVQLTNGVISAGCHHSDCEGHKEGWKKLQAKYGPLFTSSSPAVTQIQPSSITNPGQTDSGNAKRVCSMFKDRIRHITDWNQWLIYDGMRWKRDDTNQILEMSFTALATVYSEAAAETDPDKRKNLLKFAAKSESARARRDAVKLASVERGIAITPSCLDRDPWKLNVKNGTLDLKTGELKKHSRLDMLTKVAPVEYDENAKAPIWERFLFEVLGGDEELVQYLQRFVGYSATGDVSEQVLAFLHGNGANGKSTFLNTLQTLFGDYGRQAAPELLVIKKGGDHPTAVADLKGARFVVSTEIERGRGLAEVLVKQLTGGEKMKARFMRQDFFEFDPTHKIFLAANHKPIIRGNDEAIWRRIRMIPFEVTIPAEKRDHQLIDKLKAELPGILNWVVEGCLLWQRDGLGEPAAVLTATSAYRGEMDMLSDFLEECCDITPSGTVTIKALYECYLGWCEENNERTVTKRLFNMMMEERDFRRMRSKRARYWEGLSIVKPIYPGHVRSPGTGFTIEA